MDDVPREYAEEASVRIIDLRRRRRVCLRCVNFAINGLPVERDRTDLHPRLSVTLCSHNFTDGVFVVQPNFSVFGCVLVKGEAIRLPADALFVNMRERRVIVVLVVHSDGRLGCLPEKRMAG